MNKSIFNTAVAVAVAAVFCIGCGSGWESSPSSYFIYTDNSYSDGRDWYLERLNIV